jgi:hypothetical protein
VISSHVDSANQQLNTFSLHSIDSMEVTASTRASADATGLSKDNFEFGGGYLGRKGSFVTAYVSEHDLTWVLSKSGMF